MSIQTEQSVETQRQLRAAVDVAVQNIPGARLLGDGDFSRILGQVPQGSSLIDQVRVAQNLAVAIATENRDSQPTNLFDARHRAEEKREAGMFFGQFDGRLLGGNVGGQGNSGAGSSSTKYAALLATAGSAGDPAFLQSIGLSGATAETLARMGFTTQAQVRMIANDARAIGLPMESAAVDLAKMRKAEGSNTERLVGDLKNYRTERRKVDEEYQRAKAKNDPAGMRAAEEHQQEVEKKYDGIRDKDGRTKDGRRSFDSLRNQIRTQSQHRVELDGRKDAHRSDAPSDVVADAGGVDISNKIDAAHQGLIASLTPKPDVANTTGDGLIAFGEAAPSPAPQTPQKTAEQKPNSTATNNQSSPAKNKVAAAAGPTNPQRTAINQKASQPSVG